jgi:hypothetical protein
MSYYKSYRRFRSRYTKSASTKASKEKIINLKLEEFESLEIKYQTFSYDKLLIEEKRLEEKISKNSSFVQESDLYIQNILRSSLHIKKELLQTKTEKIRADLTKKFNLNTEYDEPIAEITKFLKKIDEEKREEYDKSQIIPNLGLKAAKAALGLAVPFIGLMMLTDKKKETPSYPYLLKTNDEVRLEKKLSIISENKKKTLDLIEKEFEEIIRTTKNLNDLKNEILSIEEEIRTLNKST